MSAASAPWRRAAAAAGLLFFALLAWPALGSSRPGGRAAEAQPLRVSKVAGVSMTVSDLDRAVRFYEDVLTFEKVGEVEEHGDAFERFQGVFGARARIARLRLGDEEIELVEYLAPRGRPFPPSRSNDLWFQHVAIIVADMERAYAVLREHRVTHASPSPQTLPAWNPQAGGIKAFYFTDLDGHPLEILWFPPEKGAAKWHRRSDRLFLGIDHTAIAVSNTDESLAFYRDVLGLQVAGESFNHGIEQERLNNVFGASLRITGLRAPEGPGIEFLEYLAPRTGRRTPAEWAANDLVHRQTELVVEDAELASRRLSASRAPFLSAGLQALVTLGVRGFVARDPDGHAIEFIERVK